MPNEPVSISGSRILVVDDVKENLELLTQFLELEGYEVSFALNGEKAIKLANLEPPDLILLDVMMPGIDGFETCRRLKSIQSTRDIPVIFVTGKAELQSVVEGFQIGAVDYITKPIQQEEVRARVRTHLQLSSLVSLRDDLIEQLKEHNAQNKQLLQIQRQQLIEAEKLANIGELVGQLCHELGTPMGTAITASTSGSVQSEEIKTKLQKGELGKKELEHFLSVDEELQEIIQSNLQYAVGLMTSFKQVTVDQFSQQKSCFEVGEYIRHVINILHPRMKKTPHKVVFNTDVECYFDSYPGAFSQLIINLINNSLAHGFRKDQEGTITIKLNLEDEHLILDYRDDGRGIPEKILPNVFDKYFTTAKDSGGSGLGLFILKQIVHETLGGRVVCKSEDNKGAQFVVTLPLSEHTQITPETTH